MKTNGNTTSIQLDATTARLLSYVAKTWRISEEEAVRRALEEANAKTDLPNKEARLDAFKELQRRLDLTPAKAAQWQQAIRDARR
ncbi:MAG TPA: hypothetical protein VIW64_04600 [Pyrinomonadaceae bacterium]|jgi:hypothetical protein